MRKLALNPYRRKITSGFLLFAVLLVLNACSSDNSNAPSTSVNPFAPANGSFNHNLGPGASAHEFLASDTYTQLVVEIQYMDGYKPTADAISKLKTFLGDRLHKPSGISFIYTQIAPGGKTTYTLDDIAKMEENNRTNFTEGQKLAGYFLFLDGGYTEDTDKSKVLGVTYRNTSVAIFEKTIQSLTAQPTDPQRYVLEATVYEHEFGHVLGLVNNGSPMQTDHEDTSHPHHCDNSNCLMNWQVESGGVVGNLFGTNPIPTLDQNCLDDLKANGGK